MQHKRTSFILIIAGALVVIVSGIALAMTQPVQAQCGSQASSCKNCHEVQGQKPVNNDGTAWHTSHAFGDFCYICHAGNQQAMDKATAHIGMVAPLSDIQASCAQCHPNDLQARAQVYAAQLGVQLGAASTPATAASTPESSSTPTAAPAGAQAPAAAGPAAPALEDPNLVNYVQRYKENALGQSPTNWGNVILLIMIGAMLVGGGALVVGHEGWLRFTLGPISSIEGEYPDDVVAMVPDIARLKPDTRKSLGHLLQKPDATAEVLEFLDKQAERGISEYREQKH